VKLLEAALLGALQGVTEFLPISSDGHLAITEMFLGWGGSGREQLAFDVLLHAGTLLALVLCYQSEWAAILRGVVRGDALQRRLLFLILVATLPGIVAGIFLEDLVSTTLRTVPWIATFFLLSALALISGECIGARSLRRRIGSLWVLHALCIGVAQACALAPGLSRSGMTISAGRVCGLKRREALDFSFLLALPITAGAVGYMALRVLRAEIVLPSMPALAVGFTAALFSGVCAIQLLRFWSRYQSFSWFALYLVLLSIFLFLRQAGAEQWELEQVPSLITRYGAIAVFLFAFVEAVPPMSFLSPGVVVLVGAGAFINSGWVALQFFGAAFIGATLGSMILYLLGEASGRKLGAKLHLSEDRLAAVETFMAQYGRVSLVLGQFAGFLRPAIAFISGAILMPRRVFYPWLLLGSACWAAFYLGMGWVFAADLAWVGPIIGVLTWSLAVASTALVAYWRRKQK
jgi:undecaprenyl-diphosphatase